jgi:glycosyltransferase involved in cell wall biosynthesis
MEKVAASLLVIGQGPLEDELQEFGRRLLGRRFLLKTAMPHDQIIAYFKAADVFSLPSDKTEALGVVMIEALAAGLTVVVPDEINPRQIVGDAGYFTDVTKKHAYALAIKKALTSPKTKEAITQAQKFSWDKIASAYEKIFTSL